MHRARLDALFMQPWPTSFSFAHPPRRAAALRAGNTNPFIWSSWGWLEAQAGNPDRARKLYDAAVVVDGTHACAWHKWGMLEKVQGNYARARDLWMTVRGRGQGRGASRRGSAAVFFWGGGSSSLTPAAQVCGPSLQPSAVSPGMQPMFREACRTPRALGA